MFIRVDFHTHTFASKDSLTSPDDFIKACFRRGLDRVVVTDHNTIRCALMLRRISPELIIIGEEIKTTRGELLATFVKEEIPAGLSPKHTIRLLRDQNAFISVSHPFDTWRDGSWEINDLLEISPLVDAVEIFNSRCMNKSFNKKAVDFANKNGLPGTAGSDAHTSYELGMAYLNIPLFNNSDELSKNILFAQVQGQKSPIWVKFFSQYAKIQKWVSV